MSPGPWNVSAFTVPREYRQWSFDKLGAVTTDSSPPVFTHHRRVEFADTDAGGIVHFSRFLVFMETAEHEMLRQRGIEPMTDDAGRAIAWPRVEASCRYLRPARLGDDLTIDVGVVRRGNTSMTYGFRVFRGEELLAEGRMTSVCCVLSSEQPPVPIRFPESIGNRLPDG